MSEFFFVFSLILFFVSCSLDLKNGLPDKQKLNKDLLSVCEDAGVGNCILVFSMDISNQPTLKVIFDKTKVTDEDKVFTLYETRINGYQIVNLRIINEKALDNYFITHINLPGFFVLPQIMQRFM